MMLTWNLDQYLNLTGETWQCQKNLTMTLCQQIVTSLSFFQFMVNLEQSRSQILDTWSVKFILSWIVSIYLTKTKNSTKKPLTHFSYYCFELRYYFLRKNEKTNLVIPISTNCYQVPTHFSHYLTMDWKLAVLSCMKNVSSTFLGNYHASYLIF